MRYRGLLSMLCCCRCFRRREVYEGPFPDDGERGPIVVKRMIDDGPAPTYSGRPTARLDPILEASPRPSDDLRHRTAIASGQPVSMPNMEEDPFVSPVQRSTPLLQDAGPLTRAPSRWTIDTIATPTPPPEPDIVAPLELAMSVPPTPPEPLPTTTAPIKTPSPTPAQPVPPLLESTPSRGPVPMLVQHTTTSLPSSPLHTQISVPPSPGPEPNIETLLAASHPSFYTRIKSMFVAIPRGRETAVQTDGSVDRRVLLPRVAVRLPSSKRAPKAAIPTWSTENVANILADPLAWSLSSRQPLNLQRHNVDAACLEFVFTSSEYRYDYTHLACRSYCKIIMLSLYSGASATA
ncbi:Carboxypeptidase S1 A [Alternaria alternata]|nr:Carboxypeptidase S1 A [Alternaria alternata]